MNKSRLRIPLILCAVSALLTAAGYWLSSVIFTVQVNPAAQSFVRVLPRPGFGVVLIPLLLGVSLWAVACYCLSAFGKGFLRIAALISAVPATLWALVLIYLAADFKNVFMLMRHGMELSRLLVREGPNVLTALFCFGAAVLLVALFVEFCGVPLAVAAVASALLLALCGVVFLLRLSVFMPVLFFTLVLPTAFLLAAIAAVNAALKAKGPRNRKLEP